MRWISWMGGIEEFVEFSPRRCSNSRIQRFQESNVLPQNSATRAVSLRHETMLANALPFSCASFGVNGYHLSSSLSRNTTPIYVKRSEKWVKKRASGRDITVGGESPSQS